MRKTSTKVLVTKGKRFGVTYYLNTKEIMMQMFHRS